MARMRRSGRETQAPERPEADAVDANVLGVDLWPLHEVIQRRAGRVLIVVGGQADAPQVALRLPRTVERKHVHATLMGGVEERMRPGFLEGVAARDIEDQRCRCPIGTQMQVARDERAVPGDVDVLDAVGRQGDHLVVAAAHAGIQIALLVVVLEDDVLGPSVQDGGLEVEVQRCLGMAGGRLSLCQRFDAACLQPTCLLIISWLRTLAAGARGHRPGNGRPCQSPG